ncbi:MAG: BREX system P-loop protein BrxC [Proteobacteria bacterium]|nr:BREX system P-loop protein BrxC [Pseudomonadota bacterium]
MTRIRDLIRRDIGVKVEGVVKVFDRASLASEIREYVVTDSIERELASILDTFTKSSDVLRRGGKGRDAMGIWVSGFFGSGKSHFAKVLGHLLQDETLNPGSSSAGERCIEVFSRHLSETPRGKNVRRRLQEVSHTTRVRTIAFEINSRKSLTNPNSVGEIVLSEFYRSLGLSENLTIARFERQLIKRGLYERLTEVYRNTFGTRWDSDQGRDDWTTVRARLARILPEVDPGEYPDAKTAKRALSDLFTMETITAESIADELIAWTDAQPTDGGKVQHLVFVIDEMGAFISDSTDKISELNSLAEMLGNKGKGKVWLIVTSQQDLERVVDRTSFQPALVGRLNARFDLRPHLISDQIDKVVCERILKKHPSEEKALSQLYREREGHIATLSDIKAGRHLGTSTERAFIDCYPFLPHQIRLAQDILESLSGFRVSGRVRSMISVIMDSLQEVADREIGTVVGFDQIFRAVEGDLESQEYLGASGVRAIHEADKHVPGPPIAPSRVLGVLWLIQQITWVPRVPETLAKLLVHDLSTDLPALREQVTETLQLLQNPGLLQDPGADRKIGVYVSLDEATGEWKYLNERERTIEQAIQDMVRPGGPRSISLATVRRRSQEMCKIDVLSKKKLASFTVGHGKTDLPFAFSVTLDGETIDSSAELEVRFFSPLAPGRMREQAEIRRHNQASGAKGKVVWWIAQTSKKLESRLKRYEALVKVTSDKRFTADRCKDTRDALAEKRKERDDLRGALCRDIERQFLHGTLYYGRQQVDLDGSANLLQPLSAALTSVIPNIYPRFAIADRHVDLAKQLKALFNPATKSLHEVAPDLDLFDTQGSLQRESALVGQVLEVIRDLTDEGDDATGAVLLDARDRRGFRGFARPPFGWPGQLVRLVVAACFRGGAVYLERQSAGGVTPIYGFAGSTDLFKITAFKRLYIREAGVGPTIDQLKQANRALIAMGVTGTAESSNAIADAVRKLGRELRDNLQRARLRDQQGVPISQHILQAEPTLTEAMTVHDPGRAVLAFLDAEPQWRELHKALEALHAFLDDNRQDQLAAARQLMDLAEHHPLPESDPNAAAFAQACNDMQTFIEQRTVVERWRDMRTSIEQAFNAYRRAYEQAYDGVREQADGVRAAIEQGAAYAAAPAGDRDAVVEGLFGPNRACHYPAVQVSSLYALLDAARRRSLTQLEQARVALPAYRAQVEAELHTLIQPEDPAEKRFTWRASTLVGRRFTTEDQVEKLAEELKARIRDGFVVVVE